MVVRTREAAGGAPTGAAVDQVALSAAPISARGTQLGGPSAALARPVRSAEVQNDPARSAPVYWLGPGGALKCSAGTEPFSKSCKHRPDAHRVAVESCERYRMTRGWDAPALSSVRSKIGAWLADITLAWIMQEAKEAGLTFEQAGGHAGYQEVPPLAGAFPHLGVRSQRPRESAATRVCEPPFFQSAKRAT